MKRQSQGSDRPIIKRPRNTLTSVPAELQIKIGDYIVGPEIRGNTAGPLNCIKIYLAKKGEEFYKLKVLTIEGQDDKQTKEVTQGKMLFHNEYLLLENLKGLEGIERCYGMIIDYVQDEKMKKMRRITLVLDPLSDKSVENWMNINMVNYNISLQEYISRHKMTEREALLVFYEIVKLVEKIHNKNIIHRDLKLQNFLINILDIRQVTLTNFCLGKLLSSDEQLLVDQRGSPAYLCPEILNGGNYRGKPTDVWTLGVILYILMYSNFPFVENTTAALFKKICSCEVAFPSEIRVSEATKKLIKNHLLTMSADRFTISQIREYLERQFDRINRASSLSSKISTNDDQVVPDLNKKPTKMMQLVQTTGAPKYELSTENISMVLKTMSPNNQQEQNKMFLKPSLLAERGNHISPSNSPSGSSIGARNLTRQINNLSVRNRQQTNAGLSWHNRISNSIYEVRLQSESTAVTDRVRMQQRSSNYEGFVEIYSTLNELFSNGSFPSNATVHEFQGNINQDIALKLSIWLRTNFNENSLVREIYNSPVHSPGNDIEKFVEFLRRCHVDMEHLNGVIFVKAHQTNQILIFLSYLLQLAGYNNNYFLNISNG